MATLLEILILVAPLAAFGAVAWLVDRHRARRDGEIARQIALTDTLHARLGALVAPVVRRRQRGWQVAVAVPFERPEVVAEVLTSADEVFDRGGYELVLTRQASTAPSVRASRPAALRRESLSWS